MAHPDTNAICRFAQLIIANLSTRVVPKVPDRHIGGGIFLFEKQECNLITYKFEDAL